MKNMFITNNIDLEQSENYILTIRISSNLFSFYIQGCLDDMECCYGQKKWEEGSEILAEVQQIIFENNFFTLPYSKVNVIVVSPNYELVPPYFLEKDKIKILYNFTHSEKSDHVLQDPLKEVDNVTLFGVDGELYKFLVRSLVGPQFYHHVPLVLNYVDNHIAPNVNKSWIVVNCHGSFVDVFCFNYSNVLQYNITLYQEKDIDCLYHIMNLWNKQKLDQELNWLYVIVNLRDDAREPLINSLKRYIRNVEVVDFGQDYNPIQDYDEGIPPLDLITIKDIII